MSSAFSRQGTFKCIELVLPLFWEKSGRLRSPTWECPTETIFRPYFFPARARPVWISAQRRITSQRMLSPSATGPLGKRWISSSRSFLPFQLPAMTRPLSAPRSTAR